jgi:coproporphyrinogen III oxidase
MSGADEFAVTATAYFHELQQRFCGAFEAFEPHSRFVARSWAKPAGHHLQGGGESRLLRGTVFEKVGVNVSHVWGVLPPEAHGQVAGAAAAGGRFTACGISLVAHMANPYVPAVHLNLRYLSTSRAWFGGGSDLTPTFPFEEDTLAFHEALRAACDGYRAAAYSEYKAWCDRYFYLPHRKEPRGAGGIFYDHYRSGDVQRDFAFTRDVGLAFLRGYAAIVRHRMGQAWTAEERDHQLVRRGRYVEFNLLHDRGTLFGLKTGGNIEAILMSLPPEVRWP